MKRLVLIVMLLLVFPATAQALPQYENRYLNAEQDAINAIDDYLVMKLCLSGDTLAYSPVFRRPYVGEEAMWDHYTANCERLATRYGRRGDRLWKRIIHPRGSGVEKWLPLALWVQHYDPDGTDTRKDAVKLLALLSERYGPDPVLDDPLATLSSLSEELFAA